MEIYEHYLYFFKLSSAVGPTFLAPGTGSWKTIFPQSGVAEGVGFQNDYVHYIVCSISLVITYLQRSPTWALES